MLENRSNVIALELGARLAQRRIEPRGADAALELGMGEDVLQTDKSLWNQQDQPLEQAAEFGRVTPPGQRREQRQRRPGQEWPT